MAEDTISAVTTALGEGAVGIVRISGPKALAVGETLFKAASGKALGAYPVNTLAYGHVYDTDGSLVDEVLAVYMRAPRSYTAEDVVEIQCHGGVQPLQKILQLTVNIAVYFTITLSSPNWRIISSCKVAIASSGVAEAVATLSTADVKEVVIEEYPSTDGRKCAYDS